jgi:anti-sigma B factor antagonist
MATQSPTFGVDARQVACAHVVSPRGELDLYTVAAMRSTIGERPDGCDVVVLDLTQLRFFDTSGMRLVVETMQELEPLGVRLAILRGPPDVQRLFALAGMEDRLPFFDALEEAIAAG